MIATLVGYWSPELNRLNNHGNPNANPVWTRLFYDNSFSFSFTPAIMNEGHIEERSGGWVGGFMCVSLHPDSWGCNKYNETVEQRIEHKWELCVYFYMLALSSLKQESEGDNTSLLYTYIPKHTHALAHSVSGSPILNQRGTLMGFWSVFWLSSPHPCIFQTTPIANFHVILQLLKLNESCTYFIFVVDHKNGSSYIFILLLLTDPLISL